MAAAAVASPSPASRRLLPRASTSSSAAPSLPVLRLPRLRSARRLRRVSAAVAADEADVLPGPGGEGEGAVAAAGRLEAQGDGPLGGSQLDIGGLAFQGDMGGGFAGGGAAGGAGSSGNGDGNKTMDRVINTAIVLGASTYALTKLLTVDQDYWHVSSGFPSTSSS